MLLVLHSGGDRIYTRAAVCISHVLVKHVDLVRCPTMPHHFAVLLPDCLVSAPSAHPQQQQVAKRLTADTPPGRPGGCSVCTSKAWLRRHGPSDVTHKDYFLQTVRILDANINSMFNLGCLNPPSLAAAASWCRQPRALGAGISLPVAAGTS
jgi:hypothetical protein